MKIPVQGHLLAIVAMLAPFALTAAEVTVRVTANGQPLADAVVLLRQPGLAGNAEQTAVVDQKDRQFTPFVLAVAAGTAVSFPNSDNVRHHVYSFSPSKRFELRLYSGTPTEPVVFDRPGIVTLGCNIHDWMLGFIYVTDAPRFGVTGADGRLHFTDLGTGAANIAVWHPRMETALKTEWNPATGPGVVDVQAELGPEVRRGPAQASPFGRRSR